MCLGATREEHGRLEDSLAVAPETHVLSVIGYRHVMDPSPAVVLPVISPRRRFRRFFHRAATAITLLIVLILLTWATLAIAFRAPGGIIVRLLLAACFVAVVTVTARRVRPRWMAAARIALMWLIVLGWWCTLTPRLDRNWDPAYARLPTVTIDGDRVTLRNVRNFEYRSASDFSRIYETRTYDLSKVRSVDYVLSRWGLKAVAHGFLTFGFEDGEHLAISIESRREWGESYDPLRGLFKQYELMYVVGDERDLIGLRASHRGEDVYLYHLRLDPPTVRALLLDYLRRVDELSHRAEFYNSLTHNCTTAIFTHLRAAVPMPLTLEVILNGYSDHYGYERGGMDQSMPFDELRDRSRITDAARAAAGAPDFSARIREGLPQLSP